MAAAGDGSSSLDWRRFFLANVCFYSKEQRIRNPASFPAPVLLGGGFRSHGHTCLCSPSDPGCSAPPGLLDSDLRDAVTRPDHLTNRNNGGLKSTFFVRQTAYVTP